MNMLWLGITPELHCQHIRQKKKKKKEKKRLDVGTKLKYRCPHGCDLSLGTKLKTNRSMKSVNICWAHYERGCRLPFIHRHLMVGLSAEQIHHGLRNTLFQVKNTNNKIILALCNMFRSFALSWGTMSHSVGIH